MSAAIAPPCSRPPPSGRRQLAQALLALTWWAELSEPERVFWMRLAGSAEPSDAFEEYQARAVQS
ncbi:MAG TPA: hypothetical protein VMF64_12095 [Steroidobacteraceae bacterium]|nr:hypothetical protein [Steroidobacteraceae bacterium]